MDFLLYNDVYSPRNITVRYHRKDLHFIWKTENKGIHCRSEHTTHSHWRTGRRGDIQTDNCLLQLRDLYGSSNAVEFSLAHLVVILLTAMDWRCKWDHLVFRVQYKVAADVKRQPTTVFVLRGCSSLCGRSVGRRSWQIDNAVSSCWPPTTRRPLVSAGKLY